MQVEREELDDIVHDLYGTREYELIGATRMMWPDRAVALVTLPDGTRAWAIDGGPLSRMPLNSLAAPRTAQGLSADHRRDRGTARTRGGTPPAAAQAGARPR